MPTLARRSVLVAGAIEAISESTARRMASLSPADLTRLITATSRPSTVNDSIGTGA